MQFDKHDNAPVANMHNSPQDLMLDFKDFVPDLKDAKKQQDLEWIMTPSSRTTIREVLAHMARMRAKEDALRQALQASRE